MLERATSEIELWVMWAQDFDKNGRNTNRQYEVVLQRFKCSTTTTTTTARLEFSWFLVMTPVYASVFT